MFIRRIRIKLDKGDTLGGTAPLIMLDQVRPGSDGRNRFAKRGRDKGGSGKLGLIILAVLVGLGIIAALGAWLGVSGLDQIAARLQGVFSN